MPVRARHLRDTIILGGQTYPVEGNVLVESVSPFISSIANTGQQEAENFSGANHWFIDDLTGGFGIDVADVKKDLDRFWISTISTHVARQITLPPLINTALTLTAGTRVDKFWDFGDKYATTPARKTYASTTYPTTTPTAWKIYGTDTSGTWSGTPVNPDSDLGDDVYDYIEYGGKGIVSFGLGQTFKYSADMITWTAGTAAEKLHKFCIYDGKLIATFHIASGGSWTVQLRYATDITGAFSAGATLDPAQNNSLLSHRDGNGNPCIYAGMYQGLYVYDFTNAKWYPQDLDFRTFLSNKNCLGMARWHNNALWVPAQSSIWQWTPGLPAVAIPVGPDMDDGLQALDQGDVIKVLPTMYCLYILIQLKGGGGLILRSDGSRKYHFVAATYSACHDIHFSNVTSPPRLYFDSGNVIKYVNVPDIAANEYYYDVSAQTYALSGQLTTIRFDGGLPSVPKVALRLSVRADNLTSTEDVDVYYQINGEVWPGTHLGTIESMAGNPLKFGSGAGVEFYDIRFTFILGRRSTGDTPTIYTPRIYSIDFEWLATPTRRYSYTMTLPLQSGVIPNYTGQQLLDAFNTAFETSTLLAYYPDGDDSATPKYVRIETAPGQKWVGPLTKEGKYKVKLTEF